MNVYEGLIMNKCKSEYKIKKKFVRGFNINKTKITTITLDSPEDIYSYLFDTADKYQKGKIDYIIEWYSPIKDKYVQ